MKSSLPKPYPQAILYEDSRLYACLANFPIVPGHTVIVWKHDVSDLHLLSRNDYDHLMNVVDDIRTSLIKALKIQKVYLLYMDETRHVHWHLVPRYNEQGFTLLAHKPKKLSDFSLVEPIKKQLKKIHS